MSSNCTPTKESLIEEHNTLLERCATAEDGTSQQADYIADLERKIVQKDAIIQHLETRSTHRSLTLADTTLAKKLTKILDTLVFTSKDEPIIDD